jgi:hypothetical protein
MTTKPTCVRPITPLPTKPDGSIDWDNPLPMCGKPATHYLPTPWAKPEDSTTWCAEHVDTHVVYGWKELPR